MTTTGMAMVTGAEPDLGRCIAQALLAAGWQVAAAGRRGHALGRRCPSPHHRLARLVAPTATKMPFAGME
jgi:NAD(P)-dependent dehydrogenase (short-subunit alcohol dehydrogenase family)